MRATSLTERTNDRLIVTVAGSKSGSEHYHSRKEHRAGDTTQSENSHRVSPALLSLNESQQTAKCRVVTAAVSSSLPSDQGVGTRRGSSSTPQRAEKWRLASLDAAPHNL